MNLHLFFSNNIKMPKCCVTKCSMVGVHRFPRDNRMKKLWLKAVRRPNLSPKDSTRLCRNHFLDTDYLGYSHDTGLEHTHRYLKKTAVPSQFPWNCKPTSGASKSRAERLAVRDSKKSQDSIEPPTLLTIQDNTCGKTENASHYGFTPLVYDDQLDVGQEVEVGQVVEVVQLVQDNVCEEIPSHSLETPFKTSVQKSTQTSSILTLFSTDLLLTDNESVHFYTGLENYNKFQLVLNTLLPMANNLKYRWSQDCNLSVEDQLLLLLIKLRRNKTDFELSKLFNVSKTSVSSILVTWINFVHDMWRLIDIWPSRELINYYMPDSFHQNFPGTRLIIDGTF